MLAQEHKDLLIQTVGGVFPVDGHFRVFVNATRANSWNKIVPANTAPYFAIGLVVEVAEAEGWLRDLVRRLCDANPNRPEFVRVLDEINRIVPFSSAASPFDEVLLHSGRPFVNRRSLRNHLLNLTDPTGSSILLIDGKRQTGKTFSYYLINHIAPCRGYAVSRFLLGRLPRPDELASEILGRIGIEKALPPIGLESAERWAEKLADIVARAIEERATPRILVFDDFSDTPLPAGTLSLILRLTTYSDEELRHLLRIVLMRFPSELTPEMDEVALRETVEPFSSRDMTVAVSQVANANGWAVSDQAISEKVDEFCRIPGRTLKDCFAFLRRLLQELGAAT